jgi:hypothetical protein
MPHLIEKHPDIHEQQVSKLHEAIAAAGQVTVEFGTGRLPLFESQSSHTFNANNLYIGANLDSKQHKFLADRIEGTDGFAVLSEKNDAGNINKLPIPDASADMVFMANVFGEQDSEHIMELFKNAERRYMGSSSIDAKTQTLIEAKRLLKDNGKLVILETNTPYEGAVGRKEPYKTMAALLEKSGFKVTDTIDRSNEDWQELASQFAEPSEWWSYASYMVVAQKP